MENGTVNVAKLIEDYLKAREAKENIVKQAKAKVQKLDEWMEKAEQVLLAHCNTNGLESIRSPAGTAFKKKVTSATVADSGIFMDYVKKEGMFSLLDVRANKTTVQEILSAGGELPPGLNWRETVVVQIRRGNDKE